jgi:hypothetical protein
MANRVIWGKELIASLYTVFSLLDPRSKFLKLKGECVIAWPLSYGVIFWNDEDVRQDVCCNARFFSQMDAELYINARKANSNHDNHHYEVVKLHDDK